MSIHCRLGLALLACALGAASACHRTAEVGAPGRAAVAAAAAQLSPDEIVRKRAPADEIALLDGKLAFAPAADGPALPATGLAQAAKAAAWKRIVTGVGAFDHWVGYTKAIDPAGRIEVFLSDGLVVFAVAPKASPLFGEIESLSQNSQMVVLSGRISPSFVEATAVSDDPNYPTCFENRYGPSGCEIELTDIAPLPGYPRPRG
jgi:hypothetical protein